MATCFKKCICLTKYIVVPFGTGVREFKRGTGVNVRYMNTFTQCEHCAGAYCENRSTHYTLYSVHVCVHISTVDEFLTFIVNQHKDA